MVAAFRPFNSSVSSVLRRAISIACVIIAFSYIFFEVLDLDGSNLPLQRHPVESQAIVPEVEANILRPYLTLPAEPWTLVSIALLIREGDWAHPGPVENLIPSLFNAFHRRGYRASLPRSSIPNHL